MPTPTGDVAHLLRRAGFGGSHDEVRALAALDIRAIVDRVVEAPSPPVRPPEALLTSDSGYQQWVAMTQWWFDRMASSPAGFAEKMTLFWHGHLTSSIEKVGKPRLVWDQHVLLREKGLGSVVDLVQAIAVDPAMLRYLDNDENVARSPNENFARELMELFTLGVNEYTQDDVVAAARAWTGYGLDRRTNRHVFRPNRHDHGLKTFFGVTRAWTGPETIDEILLGSSRETSARFIASRLWSFLAYPDPERAVLDAIVGPYLRSGLDVKTLARTIFLRPEFYSTKAKRSRVRSPVEYIAAAMKGTGLDASVAHPEWWVRGMGQVPFNPPDVSGWGQNGYWVSTSAQWAKASFANYLRWKANETPLLANLRDLSPEDSVRAVLRQFNIDNAGPRTRQALLRYVRRERETQRWAERPNLFFLALLSPEMQLA